MSSSILQAHNGFVGVQQWQRSLLYFFYFLSTFCYKSEKAAVCKIVWVSFVWAGTGLVLGFQLLRADRVKDLLSKVKNEGMCFYLWWLVCWCNPGPLFSDLEALWLPVSSFHSSGQCVASSRCWCAESSALIRFCVEQTNSNLSPIRTA